MACLNGDLLDYLRIHFAVAEDYGLLLILRTTHCSFLYGTPLDAIGCDFIWSNFVQRCFLEDKLELLTWLYDQSDSRHIFVPRSMWYRYVDVADAFRILFKKGQLDIIEKMKGSKAPICVNMEDVYQCCMDCLETDQQLSTFECALGWLNDCFDTHYQYEFYAKIGLECIRLNKLPELKKVLDMVCRPKECIAEIRKELRACPVKPISKEMMDYIDENFHLTLPQILNLKLVQEYS